MVSGRGTRFPAKYQYAIYALDWTYGRILAIYLTPDGASYKAEAEDFVSGPALLVTDAVVGKNGALYFTTGGRGTQSELMRAGEVVVRVHAAATQGTDGSYPRMRLESGRRSVQNLKVINVQPTR